MGAHDFTTFQQGDDLQGAYGAACDQATWESGHDPYNGTISTTNGCFLAVRQPMTLAQAHELIQAHWDAEDGEECEHCQGRGGRWTGAGNLARFIDCSKCDGNGYARKPSPLGNAQIEKWGPAAAIRIEDGERRGFLFFGLAAS